MSWINSVEWKVFDSLNDTVKYISDISYRARLKYEIDLLAYESAKHAYDFLGNSPLDAPVAERFWALKKAFRKKLGDVPDSRERVERVFGRLFQDYVSKVQKITRNRNGP